MGIETYIHLLPLTARKWRPKMDFVRELVLGHFKATLIDWLAVHSTPCLWDADEGLSVVYETEGVQILHLTEPDLIRDEFNLDVETGMAILEATKGVCKLFQIITPDWSDAVSQELLPLTKDFVYDNLCTNCPVLYLGHSSIPDRLYEQTAAESCFRLDIYGLGSTPDWDRYLEAVKQCQQFVALKRFVEERSGFEWKYMMSASC